MIGSENCAQILGTTLYGPNAEPIGVIGQIYLDDASGRPTWLTAHTGLFGTHESFVPVPGARIVERGVVVGFSRDLVRHAPRVDPADGQLNAADEALLFRHYGLLADEGPDSHLRRYGDPDDQPSDDDVIDVIDVTDVTDSTGARDVRR